MARQLYTNGAASTLNGSLTQGGTTMVLAAGEGSLFPEPSGGDYFLITLYQKDLSSNEVRLEVVQCTARTADTLTIVRDYESMTGHAGGYAYPENPGDIVYVELRWTAAGADNMLQASDAANMRVPAGGKTTPIDADYAVIVDTADGSAYKRLTWANIKATLKAYFDTLYNLYTHPNHSGDVTSSGDGATTIAAGAVTLAKMANMATASLIYRKTAEAGAPEVNTLATLKTDLGLTGTNSGDETVTTVGTLINGATGKETPHNDDQLALMDSEATNVLKKLSWSHIKAALFSSPVISSPTINNGYTEESYAANASDYSTISLANGTIQTITLNQASTTIAFPANDAGKSFLLIIKQDGNGSRTVTWDSGVKWPGGTAPTITATASKADLFSFICDGTVWYGVNAGQLYL